MLEHIDFRDIGGSYHDGREDEGLTDEMRWHVLQCLPHVTSIDGRNVSPEERGLPRQEDRTSGDTQDSSGSEEANEEHCNEEHVASNDDSLVDVDLDLSHHELSTHSKQWTVTDHKRFSSRTNGDDVEVSMNARSDEDATQSPSRKDLVAVEGKRASPTRSCQVESSLAHANCTEQSTHGRTAISKVEGRITPTSDPPSPLASPSPSSSDLLASSSSWGSTGSASANRPPKCPNSRRASGAQSNNNETTPQRDPHRRKKKNRSRGSGWRGRVLALTRNVSVMDEVDSDFDED